MFLGASYFLQTHAVRGIWLLRWRTRIIPSYVGVNMAKPNEELSAYIRSKVEAFRPIFARAAVGDFSTAPDMPEDLDEFIELYAGIQIMLEVIQEKIRTADRALQDLAAERSRLAYEHARDEALLSSIGQGIIATDQRGVITKINRAAHEMLDLARRTYNGMPMTEVVELRSLKGHRVSQARQPVMRVLASRRKVSGMYQYRRATGELLYIHLTVAPIAFHGNVSGTIAVLRDVTKEQAIDSAKSEFVALASHQLRTPLSVISWYLERILEGGAGRLNKKQQQYMLETQGAANRMKDLVHNFLKASYIELGTITMQPRRIQPVTLLRSALKDLRSRFSDKQLQLVEQYDVAIPHLMIDPTYLRMAYQNLLTNAIKFTQPGGTITVAMRKVRSGAVLGGKKIKHSTTVLSLADTGFGIPASQAKRIFEKLYRGDGSHAHVEGTGIGLYLTRALVDLWGSEIWFESPTMPVGEQTKDRKGTTFYLTLPLQGSTRKRRKSFRVT